MAEFEWVSLVIGLFAGSCLTTLVILFFAVSRGNRREDVERVDSPTLTHRRLT